MRLRRLRFLRFRHPKSRKEWRAKILAAFVFALMFEVVVLFGCVGIGTRGASGTYTPATDEIWVDPELDEYGQMVVTAHEEAHQAFYHLLPFWSLVKIPTMYLIIFMVLLGFLIISKKLLFVAGCLLFVAGLSEIHAYGITLLMFGVGEYTLPGLIIYSGFPVAGCVVCLWISHFIKPPEPKFKAKYERFRRRDRRRLVVYIAVEHYSILVMGILMGYVMFVSGFTWLVVLFMFVNLFSFLWSKKKQRQMGAWITKKIHAKTTTAK